MDINEHLQSFFLLFNSSIEMFLAEGADQLNLGQSGFRFWVSFGIETSIHIFTLGVAPVIACDNTIRINHGQDPELEGLP